jgi:hypothetical protein
MIQLVATGAAAFPLLVHFRGGDVPLNELIGSVILTCSASAACWALWYYGQRYVGELALIVPSACLATDPLESSPEKFTTEAGVSPLAARSESRAPEGRGLPQSQLQWVQISTLNFWGARQVCSEAQNFAIVHTRIQISVFRKCSQTFAVCSVCMCLCCAFKSVPIICVCTWWWFRMAAPDNAFFINEARHATVAD